MVEKALRKKSENIIDMYRVVTGSITYWQNNQLDFEVKCFH